MEQKLPPEWEAISGAVSRYSEGADLTYEEAIREAVERCFALTQKPKKELTDGEITAIHFQFFPADTKPISQLAIDSHRAVIAAYEAKQREPEIVTLRAARNKVTGEVLGLDMRDAPFTDEWEWLDLDGKPQTFEVKV